MKEGILIMNNEKVLYRNGEHRIGDLVVGVSTMASKYNEIVRENVRLEYENSNLTKENNTLTEEVKRLTRLRDELYRAQSSK